VRRPALTVALAVAASTLSLPLMASPAAASVSGTEVTYYLADTDGDEQYGLYARTETTGGSGSHVVEAESAATDVSSLATSADGTRVIYVRDNYDTGVEQVVVRDVDEVYSKVLESTTFNPAAPVFATEPQLSPNGRSAVWTRVSLSGAMTFSLRKATVATGAATTLASDLAFGFFADNADVVAETSGGVAKSLPFAGGSRQDVPGYPSGGYDFAFSRDGAKVAWAEDTATTTVLKVASYTVTNGVPVFGSSTDLATSAANFAPGFSADGTKIRFIKDQGAGGDVYEVPVDASAPATGVVSTAADEVDLATAYQDDVAPAAPTVLPAVLEGTSTLVRFSWPADPDVAYVTVWDSPTAPSGGVNATWPEASVRWYGTGVLVPGTTYTVGVQTVDRSGNRSTIVPFTFTAQKAPAPTVADPISTTSTKATFPVTFAASAPSNARFVVDYLPSGYGTYQHWVNGATGRVRTFGAPASTGVLATTSTVGRSYVFKAQVKDAYGNATAWVTSARTPVPWDQTKATLYGGTNVSSTSAYLGSYRRLSKTTDYARITLKGDRLQVVGWKCAACGSFTLYEYNSATGKTTATTVSSYAASTKPRQVLFTRYYSGLQTRTFTIKPLATSGHPYVMLDGFAMRMY
jgi:hypothetical protein